MSDHGFLTLGSLKRIAVYLFSLPFLIVIFTVLAFAQTPGGQPPAPASVQPQPDQAPSAQALKDWSAGMAHAPKSGQGCFSASYPSTEWQQVPCTTAPERPYPPARRGGPGPNVIGNGRDVSAEVTTGHLSEAIGSFDSVTGVTSETGQVGGTGGQVANTFSLQLNTNFFSGTPACNGASVPANCQGWEQFVYSNAGFAFIQYWLIAYNTTCPNGWNTATIGSDTDCWKNGANSVSVPSQVIANLVNLSLRGLANTMGSMDQIEVLVSNTLYSANNPASMLNLYQFWTEAEFNIVGDCCSSQANFNSGSSLVVRTAVSNNGITGVPSCDGQGFTGETNNLNFAGAPGPSKEFYPAVLFTESSSGSAGSPCAAATEVGSFYAGLTATHDFNGDGYSDILWRDVGGDVAIWFMHGGTIQGSASSGNVATNWSIVGTRDFNYDYVPDLLWRDTAGDVMIWLMNNNGSVSQHSVLGNLATSWSVAGTGSFTGHGEGDILWRDTSGNVKIWFMNGFSVSEVPVTNVPTIWSVAGIGDFNGDSYSDILWHDIYGDVSIWEMNGATIQQGVGLGNVATNWSIVGTGDFNGDFTSDILWRDSAGDVMIWLISNGAISQKSVLGNVPTTWSVAATGDFNGDAKSDILWIDTSGNVMIWYMNGFAVSAVNFGNVGTPWAVQGANAD